MNKLKKIRIDFRHFWPNFNPQDNFFIKFLRPHYDIIVDKEKPDFVFFSVFNENKNKNENIKGSLLKNFYSKGSRIIKTLSPGLYSKLKKTNLREVVKKETARFQVPNLKGDFTRIFYTAENVIPDMAKCDWAFSFCYDEEFKHPRHLRLPNYVTSGHFDDLIKNVNPLEVLKVKSKFCNFIYSNDVEYRNKFFEKLNRYKKVDAPGKCMNNTPPIGQHINTLSSRYALDWQQTKIKFLHDYKFTIAFENESYPGYVTEKITHPMAANSIPIYYGDDLISRDFNKKSFLFESDVSNLENLVEKIIELDRDDDRYMAMMQEPWLKDNQLNKYLKKELLLERFKAIFN